MGELIIGILCLLGLVGVQLGFRQLTQFRMKRWWLRAHEAFQHGDMQAAEAAFRKCVKLMPLWVTARTLLGAALANQGKLEEAEEELKMAAQLEPRKPGGHLGLGLFYATNFSDRGDEAVEALVLAVEYDPELRGQLAGEPKLAALRGHPRFQALVAEASD